MNNILKYGIGLLGLAVTVYVVGVAWKRSQNKKSGAVGFAGVGGPQDSRLPKGKAQCLCGGIRRDCPCPQRAS